MGRMDTLMQMVAICQEYKWTYHDFVSQPTWFIELVKAKQARDNKEMELASKHRG